MRYDFREYYGDAIADSLYDMTRPQECPNNCNDDAEKCCFQVQLTDSQNGIQLFENYCMYEAIAIPAQFDLGRIKVEMACNRDGSSDDYGNSSMRATVAWGALSLASIMAFIY